MIGTDLTPLPDWRLKQLLVTAKCYVKEPYVPIGFHDLVRLVVEIQHRREQEKKTTDD